MFKKNKFIIILVFVLGLFLSSCGGKASENEKTDLTSEFSFEPEVKTEKDSSDELAGDKRDEKNDLPINSEEKLEENQLSQEVKENNENLGIKEEPADEVSEEKDSQVADKKKKVKDIKDSQEVNDSQKIQVENSKNVEEDDSKLFEIREKMFITQINDIYFNFEEYMDYTIVLEGMFSNWQYDPDSPSYPIVYRRGPGCCGDDGWGGFFLRYGGDLPKENDWIRVTGKLDPIDEPPFLYLVVSKIEYPKERGEEFVLQ